MGQKCVHGGCFAGRSCWGGALRMVLFFFGGYWMESWSSVIKDLITKSIPGISVCTGWSTAFPLSLLGPSGLGHTPQDPPASNQHFRGFVLCLSFWNFHSSHRLWLEKAREKPREANRRRSSPCSVMRLRKFLFKLWLRVLPLRFPVELSQSCLVRAAEEGVPGWPHWFWGEEGTDSSSYWPHPSLASRKKCYSWGSTEAALC